jgi:hypothetical protein
MVVLEGKLYIVARKLEPKTLPTIQLLSNGFTTTLDNPRCSTFVKSIPQNTMPIKSILAGPSRVLGVSTGDTLRS